NDGHERHRALALTEEAIQHVTAVELTKREEVEAGKKTADPTGERRQAQVNGAVAGKQPVAQRARQQRIAEKQRLPGEHDVALRESGLERDPLGCEIAPDEDDDRHDETGERAGSADIGQLLPIEHRAAKADERAERSNR